MRIDLLISKNAVGPMVIILYYPPISVKRKHRK